MQLNRQTAAIPSLARLLSDLPRDRLATLAAYWVSGTGERPGIAALLYRAMSDRDRAAAVAASLNDVARLILGRLAAAPGGFTVEGLAERLPFATDVIEQGLNSLEERGLAWRIEPRRRDRGDDAARWLVPRDLAPGLVTGASARRPTSQAAHPVNSTNSATAPTFRQVEVNPSRARPGGEAREIIRAIVANVTRITPPNPTESPVVRFARQCGLALGVFDRRGGVVGLGPRAESWASLPPADQTRALVRLWLVDGKVAAPVPPGIRSSLARVLVSAEIGSWSSLDSVARAVANDVAGSVPAGAGQGQPGAMAPITRSVERVEVERAVEMLRWVGVVDLALDGRDRPVAVRLTANGQYALS